MDRIYRINKIDNDYGFVFVNPVNPVYLCVTKSL